MVDEGSALVETSAMKDILSGFNDDKTEITDGETFKIDKSDFIDLLKK